MGLVGRRHGARKVLVFAAVALPVLVGCAAEAAPADRVTALRIEAPVREPVWASGALYALAEEASRVAKIDPYEPASGGPLAARTTLSAPLPDVGENLTTSTTVRGAVYVPQPSLDRVAVLGLRDLRRLGTFPAGPSPSYVAMDAGSQVLLALSEDGSTVTGVKLRGFTTLPPQEVQAGPKAEVDGPARGRLVEYFVAGPRGIALYEGRPGSVEKKHEIAVSAHTTADDLVKTTRIYVGVEGTDHLLAVGVKPALGGLAVAARADLGEPVEHLGVDETRIYAATKSKLVVLETNSYEGYEGNEFSIVDTIRFRRVLDSEALESASLSGLAVGDDRVYLTLEGEPYVVSIDKPEI